MAFRAQINILKILVVLFSAGALGGCLEEVNSGMGSGPVGSDSGNSRPVIAGNPQELVRTSELYSFTPDASDPDGDSLSFTISGKPIWADFNASTGEMSGTPQPGDEGVYNGILITVSDGYSEGSIEFSVTVTSGGSASVTLTWNPPSQNEDGSILTDLAGYRIYFGDREGDYRFTVAINNPGTSTLVVDNLTPKTYYFVATSVNSAGVESRYSNVAALVAQ